MARPGISGDSDFIQGGRRKIDVTVTRVKTNVDLGLYRRLDLPFPDPAEVVELVDALASGASGRKPVGVRVPPSALPSASLQ